MATKGQRIQDLEVRVVELEEELDSAYAAAGDLEVQVYDLEEEKELLTEKVQGLAEFAAESFLVAVVQDSIIARDQDLLRRSMDAMNRAADVIEAYQTAERQRQEKVGSEVAARNQPATSNWAKAQRVTFTADGVAIAVMPDGDWSATTVSNSRNPYPTTTTVSKATVTAKFPFMGELKLTANVESVERVFHSDGDTKVENTIKFVLPNGKPVELTSEGTLWMYSTSVRSSNSGAVAKVGTDDICLCGSRWCGGSTLAPTFELEGLRVS